jgi:ergothioneine biosynthesis protein EgtB
MRALSRDELHRALGQARQYTSAMVADLDDAQWRVPQLATVNPVLWEVGHVGWFMEYWCLRWDGTKRSLMPSMQPDADRWYDSSRVAHTTRWTLDLPTRAATVRYLDDVMNATLERLHRTDDEPAALYFFQLALYHELMHAEAFAYTRQTCAYPAPPWARKAADGGEGDAIVAGGWFEQGAPRAAIGFAFDNERCGHVVELAPFAIARRPVSASEFEAFVIDGGYARAELWDDEGRAWLRASGATHPAYWRRDGADGWRERRFDHWYALDGGATMVHVNRHEAAAWCRWAGRRLPTESEWECAALSGAIAPSSVWEWTSSPFTAYPGFQADAYAEYSAPWFGTHHSVRGASTATSERLVHPKFRNFYLPERSDFFVGFRSCALT